MIHAKCIQKIRNKHNKIIGYTLIDNVGKVQEIDADRLKDWIVNGRILVLNLTLTSDGRLIDKSEKQPAQIKQKAIGIINQQTVTLTRSIIEKIDKPKDLTFKSNQNLKSVKEKALSKGFKVYDISDDIICLENSNSICLVSNKLIQLDNSYKADNGEDTISLFMRTRFSSIDFHNTDTSNVTDMSFMFFCCKAGKLDVSSFDTSNVKNMSFMFAASNVWDLNITNFNMSKIERTVSMFEECRADTIDIRGLEQYIYSLDTRDRMFMFENCSAHILRNE